MNQIEKAAVLAVEIGGRSGLNCIAEMDTDVIRQAEDQEHIQTISTNNSRERLPLAGVPVLIKDNVDVKGLHTTAGSLALADNLALSDAPIIRSLRKNGAVIMAGPTSIMHFCGFLCLFAEHMKNHLVYPVCSKAFSLMLLTAAGDIFTLIADLI